MINNNDDDDDDDDEGTTRQKKRILWNIGKEGSEKKINLVYSH